MDVFSRYLFTIPLAKVEAPTVTRALQNIMTTHSYIATIILSDKGTVFVSEVFKKMANDQNIEIDHAAVKHPQTIGTLERCHSSLKRFLHIKSKTSFLNWHRRLSFATYAYNTTYHTAIGTTPTQVFHGREPIRPLNVRFSGKLQPEHSKSLDPQQNLDNHSEIDDKATRHSLIHLETILCRGYFDRKAEASPLLKRDYCFLLNPKITKQNDRLAISECKWIGLYAVEKCLTHSNYLIRKVNTRFTQVVYRIGLRKYTPPSRPVDIIVDKDTKIETDTEFPEALEPNLMDSDKTYDGEPGSKNHEKDENTPYTRNEIGNSIPVRYLISDGGRSEYTV